MRINRYLSLCGLGSRRAVEALVLAGRVRVDGRIVCDLAHRVKTHERVAVDGAGVRPRTTFNYLVFNKPPLCLCTRSDPAGRRTIYHVLPPQFNHLHYAGRLDYRSRGLLLLSDDGEWTRRICHPAYGLVRTYWVGTSPPLTREHEMKLEAGVQLDGGLRTRPCVIERRKGVLSISLREGKNREIRRMLEQFAYRTLDLQRVTFAKWSLDGLAEGRFRRLSPEDAYSVLEGGREKEEGLSPSPKTGKKLPYTSKKIA